MLRHVWDISDAKITTCLNKDLPKGVIMREKLILVGGGGHAKIILDSMDRSRYEVIGILDAFLSVGTKISGIPVLGGDAMAEDLYKNGVHDAIITTVGNGELFRKLIAKYKGVGFFIPGIMHPKSHVSESASLGEGVSLLVNSCVNTEANIGAYVTINSNAVVEHECIVGEGTHIAPCSVLLGGCRVGKYCLIGAGSVVLPQIRVGDNCIVGAGSIVTKDLPDGAMAYGNPARII